MWKTHNFNLKILYFVTGLHQIKKSFLSFANLISRIFLTSNFPVSNPENGTKLTWRCPQVLSTQPASRVNDISRLELLFGAMH